MDPLTGALVSAGIGLIPGFVDLFTPEPPPRIQHMGRRGGRQGLAMRQPVGPPKGSAFVDGLLSGGIGVLGALTEDPVEKARREQLEMLRRLAAGLEARPGSL